MHNEWPTKEFDLKSAEEIVERHLDLNDGAPLGVFEMVLDSNDEQVDVRLADWVIELIDYFHHEYGLERGDYVAKMIVNRILISGETLH
ncbi:MAG: hypothetical protein GKR77_07465 [Legionellales bacterium]|nr:hypothetical protein [Legionellales bacterium]